VELFLKRDGICLLHIKLIKPKKIMKLPMQFFTGICMLLMLIAGRLVSQTQTIESGGRAFTQNGIFDTVADRFGNKYALKDLQLKSPYPFNKAAEKKEGGKGYSGGQTNALPGQMCTAGHFDLYFANGSLLASNTAAQTVLCQIFSDISGFLVTSLPNTVRISILCDDTPASASSQVLGTASPVNIYPNNPSNPNPGIVYNQIQKAFITGSDPFLNLPLTIFPGANNFYYGYVNVNPSPSTASWNFNSSLTSLASNQVDFYTVMLHEAMHALGFYSLISNSGVSQFGTNNNYYSHFDEFLYASNGTRLLATSTPNCGSSNLSFLGPLSKIKPGNCINNGGTTDLTACSTAVQYIGSTNVKVYTPNCWEQGSSLSHFEDICTTPPGYSALPCTASPANNNLYYVMSNADGNGTCGIKRHPTPEERLVLCDLGYGVNTVYNSTAGNAYFSYGGSACSGLGVWGVNDGLSGGSFIWTPLGSSQSVPVNGASGISTNDLPGSIPSCVEVVYGATGVSASLNNLILPTALNVNAPAGSGLVVIKYLPKITTPTIKFGNPVYVFVYFLPGNCSPPNACNLVQNGGFESIDPTKSCGGCIDYSPSTSAKIDCWRSYSGSNSETPDLFSRSCTNGLDCGASATVNYYNLGTNTYNTSTAINSFNGTPNNRMIGLALLPSFTSFPYTEVMVNNLSAPLIFGTTYQISLWVNSYVGTHSGNGFTTPINTNSSPVVISIGSLPNITSAGGPTYPAGVNVLAEFTVFPTSTNGGWQHVSTTFVYNQSASNSALLIGGDPVKTGAYGLLPNSGDEAYFFIDEVSLRPMPSPTFSIPGQVCGNTSLMNLAQYASPVTGVFAGPGVSFSGGQYNFNSPPTLPFGSYPVSFAYTSNGCTTTLWQNIIVVPKPNISISSAPLVICPGTPIILSASGAITYTWLAPAGPSNNNPITVNPTTGPVTYIVNGTAANCCTNTAVLTLTAGQVIPLTATDVTLCLNAATCTNISVSTTFAGPVVYTWTWPSGGPVTGQVLNVCPTVNTQYVVTANSSAGCSSSANLNITVTTSCCSQPTTGLTRLTSINSLMNGGSYFLENDITVSGPGILKNLEILIMPGKKITVPNGMGLYIEHVHLYACGIRMWKGIEVLDGGFLGTTNSPNTTSLIEDAETAIDLSGTSLASSTSALPPFSLDQIVFNKNYVGIHIRNADPAITALSLPLTQCVFTSRNLLFSAYPNPLSWPSADVSSSGLRFASATNGLVPPYNLQFFPQANIKSSYQTPPAFGTQSSHIGIKIEDVGNTPGGSPNPGVILGATLPTTINNPSFFNLFDGLGKGIEVIDASLSTANNVFQNMQYYTLPSGWFGGFGIDQTINSLMNARLDLKPIASTPSTNFGNRFWNCWIGAWTHNVYDVDIEYASVRSNRTVGTGFGPGSDGILLYSNRFKYNVSNCEFNNIAYNIYIDSQSGAYNIGGNTGTGTYADKITINQNYFGPEITSATQLNPGTEYSDYAISLLGGSASNWQITGTCSIFSNKIDRAYRGIRVNQTENYPVEIGGNDIFIIDDYVVHPADDQYGIYVNNSKDNLKINQNIVTGEYTGQGAINTRVKLIRSVDNLSNGNNQFPEVTLNEVHNGYKGFAFEGSQPNTRWECNKLYAPMNYGFSLESSSTGGGVVGPQGNPSMESGNEYWGNWVNNVDYFTYCDPTSNPSSSILYVALFFMQGPGTHAGVNPNVYANNSTFVNTFVPPSQANDCSYSVVYPQLPGQRPTAPGTTTSEKITTVNEWKVEVYPNPTNGNFTIKNSVENELLILKIMDINGRTVYTKNLSGNSVYDLDISSLKSSIYVIEINNQYNKMIRMKLVKTD
jgi:hypothetical protein